MPVRSLTTKFGMIAGKIWNALDGKEPLKTEKLLKSTKLEENEFYAGVGWLARENKIFKDGTDCYRLGNTNLTPEIGYNAGKVWKIMDIWGEVNISTIKRLADIDDKETYSALGWLAREDNSYIDNRIRCNLE